jgi:nucleoside-diphosphate-sugar epimerase
MNRILVTGARAGFVGHAISARLLSASTTSPYYDLRLKQARLHQLEKGSGG